MKKLIFTTLFTIFFSIISFSLAFLFPSRILSGEDFINIAREEHDVEMNLTLHFRYNPKCVSEPSLSMGVRFRILISTHLTWLLAMMLNSSMHIYNYMLLHLSNFYLLYYFMMMNGPFTYWFDYIWKCIWSLLKKIVHVFV